MPLQNVSDSAVWPLPALVAASFERLNGPSLTVGKGLAHGGRKVMALTGAERQRRYMERLGSGTRVVRSKPPQDRHSKPKRWRDAVVELLELQEHYCNWLENLPENQQDGVVADRLREIAELDIEALLAVEPPRGYGRDT